MNGYEILTAETERGRAALAEVMASAYVAQTDGVPPAWVRVLLADGVPVSFIVVDPARRMEQPGGDLPYAFICDVATRQDRRGEGHFRRIMEHTFDSLRAVGTALVVTHGDYRLYRRFGFDVFTHHSGIFVTPEQIERHLGAGEGAARLLTVEESRHFQEDLLLVADARAGDPAEARLALQAAARLARARGKARILFEHPAAPSYGSRYPIHPSPETPLTALARSCGARVCVQGADPESGPVPDADWILVLDAAAFLRQALPGGRLSATGNLESAILQVRWPAAALAQWVTGYRSARLLCAIHNTPLPEDVLDRLDALFPPRWRFSRNESWVFRS